MASINVQIQGFGTPEIQDHEGFFTIDVGDKDSKAVLFFDDRSALEAFLVELYAQFQDLDGLLDGHVAECPRAHSRDVECTEGCNEGSF